MKALLGIAAVIAALGLGAFAFVYFAGGSGEPTTDVTAPTIISTATTAASTEPTGTATTDTTRVSSTLDLILADATARFELDEVLRGEPTHVVGSTTEVAGRIQTDPADLSTTVVSDIIINARTFATDSGVRDRAIRGPVILDSASDEFELITFSPTSIEGLADSVEVGEQLSFKIEGDLEIKGTTHPVVFDVVATLSSADTIEGTATTSVDRTKWGIDIPSVASVADVTDEVLLTIEFVARPEA